MTVRVRRTAQMQNHVSSKPFKHIAATLLCQPAVHTPFTQGFPQLSGAECLRCDSRIGPHPAGKPASGARLSANSNMRPSPGVKTAIFTAHAEAKGLKTCQKINLEFLLKEPFGNSIPESKLRGRS